MLPEARADLVRAFAGGAVTALELSSVVRLRPDVRLRVVEGEAVVLVQDRAVIVGLDASGTRVIGVLDRALSAREIAASLRRQLDAGTADVEGDVVRFLNELLSLGVIERVEAPASGAGT